MASLVEAIALIDEIRPVDTPLATGRHPSFYRWITGTLRGLDYSRKEQFGGSAMAVTHFTGVGRVTLLDGFFGESLVRRAAMLVHEGRHAMYPHDPGHVTCTRGTQAGKPQACDRLFHIDGGTGSGYSWGWVFMWYMTEQLPMGEKDRDDILGLLKWELNNRFNSIRPEDKAFFMNRWNWDGR